MRPTPRNLRVRSHKKLAAGAVGSIGAIAAAVALASPGAATAGQTILGSGSSAASTEVNALIAGYEAANPGITIKYNADGGNQGIADVQNNTSQFSIQTAAPSQADAGTSFNKLFGDAVIIGVNSKNKLSSASFPTIKNIFTGLDTKWSQIRGATGSLGSIDPFGRASSAGLYTIVEKAILYPQTQSASIPAETSDGEVAIAVSKNKSGIGYIGLASSHKDHVRALALSTKSGGKAVAPTNQNILKFLTSGGKSGYPLAHYDYGVLPSSNPSSAAKAFITWIQTSKVAAGIINRSGGISL